MKISIFLLFIFCAHTIVAQEPYALRLDKKSGLPSQSVYQLYQDKQGYFWFASDVGLTRYDGFRFETFYSDDQTSFAGSCILEDKLGRIWYENFDGYLYYLDPKERKLKSLGDRNSLNYLPYGISDKYVFHIDKNGISVYDIVTLKKVKTFKHDMKDPEHAASVPAGFMMIEQGRLHKIDSNLQKSSLKIDFIEKVQRQVFYINDTCFILGNKFNEQQKLFIMRNDFKRIATIDIPKFKLIHIINYIDNLLWISTPRGTYVYDLKGKLIHHFFPESSISCVLKDRQNNYWFSTTNQGVFIVPNLENKFLFGGENLPSKIIHYKNDTYLVSTKKGGIFQVDKNLQILKTIINTPELGEIFYLYYDPKSDILSYTGNQFYRLDCRTFKDLNVPGFSVKEIVPLDEKYILFASSNVSGLLMVDKNRKSEWDNLNAEYNDNFFNLFSNQRTRSVAFDSLMNNMYFATNNGLFKVSKWGIEEVKYKNKPFFAARLTLFNGVLYALSTKGNLYEIKNDLFTLVNKALDISEYDIRFLRNFGDRLIFASSSYIYQLDKKTKQVGVYNLNIAEYDINDIFVDGSSLFLVVNQGVIKTSLNNKFSRNAKPIFKVNKLISRDLTVYPGRVIQLDYDYNMVKIEYSILDFGKSVPTSLFYRINNSDWQKTSALSRELTFPSLESGAYKVDFKFKDSEDIQTIEFVILKPWWKETWFILLVIFVVVAFSYNVFRLRVKSLSSKNKLLEDNLQLEKNLRQSVLTTIKSQMNPHFFYNALNTIQAYIYANDKENAGKYLVKFSKLTRKVLEMSEQENVGLDEELETITLYLELEKARFDDDFNFEIDILEIAHHDFIKIPPMLIQPYIENAVKHGLLHKVGNKMLKIKFAEIGRFLLVTIDDNGIGRKRSAELNVIKSKNHKSFASEANSKRLDVLNYGKTNKVSVVYLDKTDNHGNPSGTRVELRIPINN